MTGTASQIELAEQIRPRVEAEFHRVAGALRATGLRQNEPDGRDTRLRQRSGSGQENL